MDKEKKKRYKWLHVNLSKVQMIKYFLLPKKKIDATNVKRSIIEPYEIKEKLLSKNSTLLVKPSGLKKLEKVWKKLDEENILILSIIVINDYKKYAKSIFHNVMDMEHDVWFTILENYYAPLNNMALLFYLDIGEERVKEIKCQLRKQIGIDFYKVVGLKRSYITSITPVHTSEREERMKEEYVIKCMIQHGEAIELDKESKNEILRIIKEKNDG